MLMKKAKNETPGVPKTLFETFPSLLETLKAMPSSVNSFVKSIKGKSPGKTELKNNFNPETVPSLYLFGLFTIISIIKIIAIVKKLSIKSDLFQKMLVRFFDEVFIFVGVILKYMLKC